MAKVRPVRKGCHKNKENVPSPAAARPHLMSLDEMAAREPVCATQTEPPEIGKLREQPSALYVESELEPEITLTKELIDGGKGRRTWRISLHSLQGTPLSGMPVFHMDRIELAELRRTSDISPITASHRPPWVDLEYIPKLVPHRFPRPLGLLERGDRCAYVPPLRLFSQHNEEAQNTSYPWRCIGKIFTGDGTGWTGGGTGVLVGPNLMMTASHVCPWDVPGGWMLFSPGFREGRQHPDSFVTRARGIKVGDDDDPSGYDYIICQLERPLGEMLGWFGSQSFGEEDDYYSGRWTSVGYPSWFFNGNRPAVEFNIDIDDIDNDAPGLELETNFGDAFGGGWSGGPLFGVINNDFKVIGIKSGWEWDGYDPLRGVFAGGTEMVNLIKHGLAHFR